MLHVLHELGPHLGTNGTVVALELVCAAVLTEAVIAHPDAEKEAGENGNVSGCARSSYVRRALQGLFNNLRIAARRTRLPCIAVFALDAAVAQPAGGVVHVRWGVGPGARRMPERIAAAACQHRRVGLALVAHVAAATKAALPRPRHWQGPFLAAERVRKGESEHIGWFLGAAYAVGEGKEARAAEEPKRSEKKEERNGTKEKRRMQNEWPVNKWL